MKHTFGSQIRIPIQHSVNTESIGNTTTIVLVCGKCGLIVSNEPYGWWNHESLPSCSGFTDEAIPSRQDVLIQYKTRFEEKNREALEQFDKHIENLHQVYYKKKVEWDEEH